MTAKTSSDSKGAFSTTAIIGMVVAGVFSFSALAVLSAFAPDLRTGGDGGGHALSKSAIGFAGLVKLLTDTGTPVVVSRDRQATAAPGVLTVLTPDPGDKVADIKAIAERKASLIILPKWQTLPDTRNREWVTRFGVLPADQMETALLKKLSGGKISRRKGAASVQPAHANGGVLLDAIKVDELQTISGSTWRPVIVDETGAALLLQAPGKPMFLLTDPDLLDTYGLRTLAGAKTAIAILNEARPGPAGVVFDVTLNGYERGRSILKMAFEPPFLTATLCAFFAAILMGLHAAIRFGASAREERAFGLGKRALADNQAALIRMAKREHRMAESYAGLIRDQVARSVGAGPAPDAATLEAILDRLGHRRTELSIAALMQDSRQVTDPAGLMRLARRLHQWKLEITRERQ
ncbi:hypothetical protein BH11PSE2_BH11PSE2_13630 [soil metagenome]